MNPLFIFKTNQALGKRLASQRGVSLIETMVGMGLGILVSLIIVQVWGNFESQKQRTVSGSSAQENGLLALTELEVDVRGAGAGLTDSASFDCTSIYSYYETGGTSVSPVPAYGAGMGLVPVQITDGGTGSDTLTAKRGSDFLGALPAVIASTMPSSSSELNVNSVTGFADGDVVLAIDSSTGKCTVMSITQVQGSALKLQHNPGSTTTYNPPTSFQSTNAWPAFSTGAKILKIGNLLVRSYTVNASNQLVQTATNGVSAVTTAVLAADIVKLKAQYGISSAAGQPNVSAWVNATVVTDPITGVTTDWSSLDPTKVKRIKAIRLVIVARSSQREGADVTATCVNNAGTNNGPCAWVDTAADPAPLIDLSANADWKKYRYRVYQSVIPMRNVIWAGV